MKGCTCEASTCLNKGVSRADRCSQGFFVTVRAGTVYREMKMRNVYFVCYASIAVSYNKSCCAETFQDLFERNSKSV